jgi:copper(I)-binding protein
VSRPNRPRLARVVGAAVLSAVAAVGVSSCASGQHAQTAQVLSGVDGAHATEGPLQLADITLAYPSGGVYQTGSDAHLEFTLINNGQQPITLVSVASPVAANGSSPNLTVAPQSSLGVYDGGPAVTLSGLKETLRSAQQAEVTFTFSGAGADKTITVGVPVAAPLNYLGATPTSGSSSASAG